MDHAEHATSSLNDRELKRFAELKSEWDEFQSPGFLGRQTAKMAKLAQPVTEAVKDWFPFSPKEVLSKAAQHKVIHEAMQRVAQGGGLALKHVGQQTLSRSGILKRINNHGLAISDFGHICTARSYRLESIATSDWLSRWGAGLQGLSTGALGGAHGLALNLACSMLFFLRATQRVALHYGYDATGSIEEQEIASQVTLQSLHPGETAAGGTGDLMYRLMQAGELSALNRALRHSTYRQMAEEGGAQLFYVRIRALAHKSAQKAIDQAGKEGIENTMLRRLLQNVGEHLPKRVGRRIVPVVAGGISALLDLNYMHRVIRGANLFYHKRFLAEKDERVRHLMG